MRDFIDEINYYGLSARIKRLSDTLYSQSKLINTHLGFEVEPNWHLVFLSLKEQSLSVTEIAKQLQFSHPGIIKIIKKMKAQGFVKSNQDKKDSRRQVLSLTAKSKKLLPKFEEGWEKIQSILKDCADENFIENIRTFEQNLKRNSIVERYKKTYKK